MAAFTSVQSGNWNDNATWGTGAGVYPGSTGSQADTAIIAATHTVDINVATVASGATVAVTVNAGSGGGAAGTLRVSAIMSAAWITTITTNYTAGQERGHLTWATGGTYTLMTAGAATLNGDFNMDASGAGSKLTWNFGNYGLTFGANSTITNLKGATKTVMAQFVGAPDGTHTCVDDGAGGDVSGWVVNDYICGTKNADCYDRKIITADDGFSGGKHQYNCALITSLQDNGRCINLTRTAILIGSNTSSVVSINAGCTVTNLQYVELVNLKVSAGGNAGNPTLFTGCSWYQTVNNACNNVIAGNLTVSDCVYYNGAAASGWWGYNSGSLNASFTATRCISIGYGRETNNLFTPLNTYATGLVRLYNCESAISQLVYTDLPTRSQCRIWAKQCRVWGAPVGMTLAGQGTTELDSCVFGQDIGGNAVANTKDLVLDSASCDAYLDNCLLTASTEVSVAGANPSPRVISTNHDQITGARKEWQSSGTCTKIADTDFVADVCDEVDPSSATVPFRYRICFPCVKDATPTLSFNHKRTGAPGICTVTMGYQTAGLTGINAGGTITLSDTVASHSVTFTGTASLGGMVEVMVEVLDGDGSDTLRIGDIAVSGNT